jgi:deoxyribodipyrimidine photolyase-like uncharacterized protein
MGASVVLSDYNEESNFSVVPICIGEIDPEGNPIHRAWVEQGVVPIADPLRKIATRVLSDVWRVSEITERAVHSLSRKHHGDLGDEPSLRVLKRAHWYAEDLRAGGRRARRKTEVELFTAKLETLQDQFDLISDLEAKETLDRLMQELDRQGLHDIREMVPMMLRDCDANEFVRRFGKSRNTLSQRFYRGMRRAARAAGITR